MRSEDKYSQLFRNADNKPGQQVQKYHRVLGKGFAENNTVDVVFYSRLPLSRSNCARLIVKKSKEQFYGRTIIYGPFIGIPVLSHILQVIDGFITIVRLGKKNIVIMDVLIYQ